MRVPLQHDSRLVRGQLVVGHQLFDKLFMTLGAAGRERRLQVRHVDQPARGESTDQFIRRSCHQAPSLRAA